MSVLKSIESSYGGFSELGKCVSREKLGRFSSRQHGKLKSIFARHDVFVGVEWIARHYLASKKISLAALYFTQSQTLQAQGMKNLSFYACYYSLFSALSANMLLNADFSLEKVRSISHSALARDIENFYVRQGLYAPEIVALLEELRFCRELYSYHLPISGDVIHGDTALDVTALHSRLNEVLPVCMQMADMQSYLTYYAWKDVVGDRIDITSEYMPKVDELFWSIVQREGPSYLSHTDRGDYRLLAYYLKMGSPIPISWFINEKLMEDVECAWGEQEGHEGYQIDAVARYLSDIIRA